MRAVWLVVFAVIAALPVRGDVAGAKRAADQIVWLGCMSAPQERLFLLSAGASQRSSPWLSVGQTWRGYFLASFDPDAEILTVTKNGISSLLHLGNSKIAGEVSGLVHGDFILADGSKVYSPDAVLKLRPDVLVSSPSGVMVSDPAQEVIAGDLTLQIGKNTLQAKDAVLYSKDGKLVLKAKSLGMTGLGPKSVP